MKKSLPELLASFARKLGDRREQDGIRGYLRSLKELANIDILYVAKVNAREASVVVGLNGEENFDEFVYSLESTPCDIASTGSVCIYSPDVQEHFPEDVLLVEMDIHGYIGVPLFDINGAVSGIIVGLNHHKEPISKDDSLLFQMVTQLIQVDFRNLMVATQRLDSFKNVNVLSSGDWGKFFYTVLEHLPGNISVVTSDDTLAYVNKGYAEFMGVSTKEIIGRNINDILPEVVMEEYRLTDNQVIQNKKSVNYQHEVVAQGYPKKYFNVTKFPFINSQNEVYAIGMMSIDITEKVENDQELFEEKIKNIQNSKLATVGEMTASITHEIGNPITIVQGVADKISMLIEGDFDVANLKKDIGKIKNASERMSKLVKSLRIFSRDEGQAEFKDLNLLEVIDVTVNLTSHRIETEQIQFTKSVCCDNIIINAQTVLLSQVIVNLLLNAADAISDLDDKWIKLLVNKDEDHVFIRVVDSGNGIDEETANKIFDSFFTTKPAGKGTGLGLSLCKEITQQHNGSLEYELHEGHTSFKLTLPLIS